MSLITKGLNSIKLITMGLFGSDSTAIDGLMCFHVTMKNKCVEVEKKSCNADLVFRKRVTNEGTVVFSFSFHQNDAAETAVIPKTIEWDLIDADRNVVNNRYQESEELASTVDIELTGNDISQDNGYVRYLSLRCTYDSNDYGDNLPLNAQIKFLIKPWKDTIVPA